MTAAARSDAVAQESCPLTCQHCRSAPVARLLVTDLAGQRIHMLICEACAMRDAADARWVAKAASAVWLFTLTPIETTAATAATGQKE